MKIITVLLATLFVPGQLPAQQDYPREVTVSGIPGVVAAGAKWEMAEFVPTFFSLSIQP
jgi:hypothetical protein